MTDSVKILDVKKSILDDNDADANVLRGSLKKDKLLYINIMSSPGSGKTTTLLATIARLKDEMKIGVMEADIDSDVDAKTIANAGVKSIQLHTGGMCHLDADMSRQGLKELGAENLDVVFLENVGNLVCPAEFDTGSQENVCILSVPEGDDKPLKYPLIFTKCNLVLVNKCDAMPVFDFDMDKVREHIAKLNPNAKVIPISAKTGEGVDRLLEMIDKRLDKGTRRVTLHLPYDKGGLLDMLYREAKVEAVEYGQTIDVTAVCGPKTLGQVEPYLEKAEG